MLQSERETLQCPKCNRTIVSDDVNVANDVAYCRSCNSAYKLSELVHDLELMDGVDFLHPPPGVTYTRSGGEIIIGITHRSIGTALGTLAFAMFWNGIVSVFVLIAIAGTLHNLNVPIPGWFPAPAMSGRTMGTGIVIFMWIFLSPFIVIGFSMIGLFFMSVGGRTEVRLGHRNGMIFTGIGPFGFRKNFETSKVTDVSIETKQWRGRNGSGHRSTNISMKTRDGRVIRFGKMLSEERKKFVAASVYKALVH